MIEEVLELKYDVEGVLSFDEKNMIQKYLDDAQSDVIIYNVNNNFTALKDVPADEVIALGLDEVIQMLDEIIMDDEFQDVLDMLRERNKISKSELYIETDFLKIYQDLSFAYFVKDQKILKEIRLEDKNLMIEYLDSISLLSEDNVKYVDRELAKILIEEIEEYENAYIDDKETIKEILKQFS